MITKLGEVEHILTPNGTVMEIEINNYPFDTSTPSKLAIRGYIAVDGIDKSSFIPENRGTHESTIKVGNKSNRGMK